MDQVDPYFIDRLSSQDAVTEQIPNFHEIKSDISKDQGVVENSLEKGDPDVFNNGCNIDSSKSEEKPEIPGCSTLNVTPDVESSNNTVGALEIRDTKRTPFNKEDTKDLQNNTDMKQIPNCHEIESDISKDKGVVENSLEKGDPDVFNNGCNIDSSKSEEKTEIPGCSTLNVTPDVESSNNTVGTLEIRDTKRTPFNKEVTKDLQNNTDMKQPCKNDNLEICKEENDRKITARSNDIEMEENKHNMEILKNNDKKELAIIEELEISPGNKSNMTVSRTVSETDMPKQEQYATSQV